MKLKDRLQVDFLTAHRDLEAAKMLDVEIIAEHGRDVDDRPFPGGHIYVFKWWELANGYAVGWNSNPMLGHCFPVVKLTPGELRNALLKTPWRLEKRSTCYAILDVENKPVLFIDDAPRFYQLEACGSVTSQGRTKEELKAIAETIVAAVNSQG